MVYIHPGGTRTGIAFFYFDKVSFVKHPSGHLTKLTTFIPISFSLFCDISTTLQEKSPAPAAIFTDNC